MGPRTWDAVWATPELQNAYDVGVIDGTCVMIGLIGMGQAILQKKIAEARTMYEIYEVTGQVERFEEIMSEIQGHYDAAMGSRGGADE